MIRLLVALSILAGIVSCKKSGSNGSGGIIIDDLSQNRLTSNSDFRFIVTLDEAASQEVKVDYTTQDGSAVAGTDFIAKSGTLTIPAGQKSGFIDVQVKGDSLRGPDKLFTVKLSNPLNATIKDDKASGTIINANGLYFPVDNAGYSTPNTYPGYTLVWNDEFSGRTVNSNDWAMETGNNGGWGNNELQNYTGRSENVFVSNGNLIIEARAESLGGHNYTSTRMITKDRQKFKFGRVDIRAKLPKGKGIWPALWMLGNNIDLVGWPKCGEIDIMEIIGSEPSKVHGTVHFPNATGAANFRGASYTLSPGSFDQEFHVYSLIWEQDLIKILVDDKQYFQISKTEIGSTYPFNADFFFIFNIAVGGNWPGSPDGTTVFPQRMVVDYVRVFQ